MLLANTIIVFTILTVRAGLLIMYAVADPGGYLLYPWIPPFWLAMYNRSVFSTEDHDLLRPPLLYKWIQEAMEQLTYEYFERILSSNATSSV